MRAAGELHESSRKASCEQKEGLMRATGELHVRSRRYICEQKELRESRGSSRSATCEKQERCM
jgi:hypothetical protein